jgi:hypothetical protein
MKFYAHRGNISGPKSELENTRAYIDEAFRNGFDVEIDVRYINGKYYLGHDKPQEEITKQFLEDSRLLVHAKTIETFQKLLKYPTIHSFYQDLDHVCLTSKNKVLYHEDAKFPSKYSNDEIVVDLNGKLAGINFDAYGVVSHWVSTFSTEEYAPTMFKLLVLDVDGVLTTGKKNL